MDVHTFLDENTTNLESAWDKANRAMDYAKVAIIETALAEVYDILKQSTKSYND